MKRISTHGSGLISAAMGILRIKGGLAVKENIGYSNAIELARNQLAAREPHDVVESTAAIWDGARYHIPWMNNVIPLDEGSIEEQIIWHHYLLGHGPKQLRGRLIAYKQVPGAAIYNSNFLKRCVNPMVNAFANDLDLFLRLGQKLGGQPQTLGDASFTITALPHIPLTYILWQGDDEIPANGNILFDESAIEWLCAEDLVVLSGMPVYTMLKMLN